MAFGAEEGEFDARTMHGLGLGDDRLSTAGNRTRIHCNVESLVKRLQADDGVRILKLWLSCCAFIPH